MLAVGFREEVCRLKNGRVVIQEVYDTGGTPWERLSDKKKRVHRDTRRRVQSTFVHNGCILQNLE
jgi:hypothetical protein